MSAKKSLLACLSIITILSSFVTFCSAIPIGLRCGTFDPDFQPLATPDLFSYSPAETDPIDFFIVQFDGPITPEMRSNLTARGASILRYLPTFAYIVKMAGADCADLMEEGALYHVEVFQPYYKVSPRLFPFVESMGGVMPGRPTVDLTVQVFAGEDCDTVSKTIAASGFSVKELAISVNHRGGKIRLNVASSQVGDFVAFVSHIKSVEWVEEWFPFELNNHEARWITQSYVEDSTPLWDVGLDGTGQLVAIGDTGVDADMCYFYDSAEGLPDDTINHDQRKIIVYYDMAGNGDWDNHDHGTHVACTVAGDNLANEGQPDTHDGMAYNAKLVFLDIGDGGSLVGLPNDLNDYFIVAYNAGARIHSNSWGSSMGGMYTTDSQACDEFMWDHPDFLAVFSNGNDGPNGNSVGSPATAKGILSSGATENYYPTSYDPEDMADFSSRGPCDDGRMKPTVGAPGYYITSADNDFNISSYNCGTRTMYGTSMSCPVHAGCVTLVRQYFVDGYYPTGEARPKDSLEPSAALMKAILVNSGREMTGDAGGSIPNDTQGWGRTLLEDTLYFGGDDRPLWVRDETDGLQTGEDQEYNVRVSGDYFEVTLVWTDYPAAAQADPCLVNDLDLEVTYSGTTYLGNVYSGGQSTTGGSADRLNPIECVQLNAPESGAYTITVRAHNVPNGPQPFALVISGVSGHASETTHWPMFRHNALHTGRTPVSSFDTSPLIKWSYIASADSYSSPVEGTDGTIYFMMSDGNLVANEPDGTFKWSYNVGATSISSPAVTPEGFIVVGNTDGVATAVNPDGSLAWTYYAGNAIYYEVTADADSNSCFTTMSNKVVMLSPTGATVTTSSVNGLPKSPVITDTDIYVGTTSGYVYQLHIADGSATALTSGLGDISNSAAMDDDGSIYVGNASGTLYKVASSGTIEWSYSTGDRIASSVAIATDHSIVFGCNADKVIALQGDGAFKWSYDTPDRVSSSPALDCDQNVVVGCRNGMVYHLDRDGNLNWSLDVGGDVASSPAITQDGNVVVVNGSKLIYIARENTAPVLSDDSFSPSEGSVDTDFSFYVHYQDADDDAPDTIYVNVSDAEHQMTLDSGDPADGVYIAQTKLEPGDHRVFYYTEDGFGGSDRIPESGTKQGPVVNHDPELSDGTVTPAAGNGSTVFEYTVHYYDLEGQIPSAATVIIDDGTPVTMTLESGDPADGVYTHSTTLSQGGHTYRFYFEDDEGRAVSAPASGDYDGPAVGDDYEPDDTCEDAKPILDDGTLQARSLMPEGDLDWAEFEAQLGAKYVAQTYGDVDTYMYLIEDDCVTVITHDDDDGEGLNAMIEWTCEAPGTYYFVMEGYSPSDIGDYELELLLTNYMPELSDPSVDPECDDAGSSFLYSVHYYDQDGDAAATMAVYVDGSPYGMTLASGDSSDGTYEYEMASLAAGQHTYRFYFVDVRGGDVWLPSSGFFRGPFLTDEFENDDTCASAAHATVGTTQYHTFCPAADVDWVSFDASAGQNYVIRTHRLSDGLDTILYLYENDCSTVVKSDDDGGPGMGSQIVWQCGSSGAYRVQIMEKSASVGGYDLLIAEDRPETEWLSFHHDNQNTGRTHYCGPNTPDLKWTYDTTSFVYDSSAAITDDGRVHIGSRDSHVYAIDSEGAVAWSFNMNGPIDSGPLADAEGNVYVDAWSAPPGGHLYKLNSSGIPVWSYYTRSGDSSPVIDDDGTLFVASSESKFIAIASDGTLKWSYDLGAGAYSHPCLDGLGSVYFGADTNYMYCLNTSNGSVNWSYETSGDVVGGAALDLAGRVLFGSADDRIYCLNSDGTFAWSYTTGDDVEATPAIGADGNVYFGSCDDSFYALDADGNLLWSYETGGDIRSSAAIDGNGDLYFGSADANLYCLSSGGALLWTWQTGAEVHSSPSIAPDGSVVFGSLDYKVYCLTEPDNQCPALSGEGVSPPLGKSTNAFTYSVDCLDSDSEDISASTIFIDDTLHLMTLESGIATDGTYIYTTSTLSAGTHEYYFLFEDTDGCETRYPASDAFSGPIVDDTRPWSECSCPTFTTDATIAVSFVAGDTGGSGLYNTRLYYRFDTDGNWTNYDYLEGPSGTFYFFASEGEGTYYFQTLALDSAGNLELGPIEDGDDSTIYDLTAPSSSCSSPAFASSSPVQVAFVASDADSGIEETALFYNYDGEGWTDSGVSSMGDVTEGTLEFTPTDGEGTYEFYTIATDEIGHTEAPPATADTATLYDTAAPQSSCTSAQYANSSPIAVDFTASDGLSGVDEVALWFNFDGEGWTDSGLSETGGSGSFDFTPADGDGNYEFYTTATDNAGNAEAPPATADTATLCDTAAPQSSCTSPEYANSSPIAVDFTASDAMSGVGEVVLWFNFDGEGWADSGLSETGGSGSFDFAPADGDGTYEFYTIATDNAGNAEAPPASADTATLYDTAAPQSSCTSPEYANSSPIAVDFTASDPMSGVGEVALWFNFDDEGWTDSGLSQTGGSGSFDFTPADGDGMYEFYTTAADNAGNVEAAPGAADDSTVYDTVAPQSSCTSPQYSNGLTIAVDFAATDALSGVHDVRLSYSFDGGAWTDSGLADSNASGSFYFTPSEGDGTYGFQTVAKDYAGNSEGTSSAGDAATTHDTIPPESSCTSSEYSNDSPIAVAFQITSTDSADSVVALYYYEEEAGWTDSGLTETGASGTFNFTPSDGDGTYKFFTLATDPAGNVENGPSTADSSTIFDTTPPQSAASSPESVTSAPFDVHYSVSDMTSGVAQTQLWYRFNGGTWADGGQSVPGVPGSFDFDAPDGEGTYDFYTIATDNAGNVEAAPPTPDSTTVYSVPEPQIWVSADSIDFGQLNVGENETEALLIRNDGDSDLIVSDISVDDGSFDFDCSSPLPITLVPGDDVSLEVIFSPNEAGLFEGELSIISTDPDTPVYYVALSGEGVAVGELTLDVSANGDAFVFGDTLEIDISVENTGGPVNVDVYFVLTYDLGGPEEMSWSASVLTQWTDDIRPFLTNFPISAGLDLSMQWWSSILPSAYPKVAKSGTYTLRMVALEPGTLNFASNYAIDDFVLMGDPFVDVFTNAGTYSLTADTVRISLDVGLPSYTLISDFYLVLLGPDGEFWLPSAFGADVVWMPGIHPMLTSFESLPNLDLTLEAVVMNLPSDAPFDMAGQFMLFAALVEPGTMTTHSNIGTAIFTLQ